MSMPAGQEVMVYYACFVVYEGMGKSNRRKRLRGKYGDLWRLIYDELDSNALPPVMTKVKSHIDGVKAYRRQTHSWQMALDGIRRVVLHRRLCVLVFGAAHRRLRFAPDPRPVLSTRVCRVQVYYFFVKTKMSGFFQTVFYFGYSAPPPLSRLCAPGPALLRCHSRARRCNCSVDFLRGPRRDVRNFGLLRLLRLRAPHLREYQVGLTVTTRSPTTGGASCVVGLMT